MNKHMEPGGVLKSISIHAFIHILELLDKNGELRYQDYGWILENELTQENWVVEISKLCSLIGRCCETPQSRQRASNHLQNIATASANSYPNKRLLSF